MKLTTVFATILIAAGLTPLLSAADEPKPLYDRLGGQSAVAAVVGDLVDRILADTRVNGWFAHAGSTPEATAAYKATLADFVCQSTGGPCEYKGRDMTTAHEGRAVTSDAFGAVVDDLIATLAKFNVPQQEQDDLLQLLGGLKPAIVQE
ncbi:MAG: group 1 truncated hemoglobin [Acidobacteria bacterium]|nr:group 1 truncated hemoglobin [Acidobacteriota bacterium]MDA1236234.1 group 1 truncated hemoglobin [Acidobacteriota bacterium]